MGQEHKGKGVNVQLGPVAGPLGRAPEGGRGWEGFSPDPCECWLLGFEMLTDGGRPYGGVYGGNYQGHSRCRCYCMCKTFYWK
jgi:hypothetical protein